MSRKPTDDLWQRVNQPDVPVEIAPKVRDALRMERIDTEAKVLRRIRERLPAALRDVSLIADLYDERQTDTAAAAIADILEGVTR